MTDDELATRLRADFPTMPDAVVAACIAARWHPHQFGDLVAPYRQPPTNPTVGPGSHVGDATETEVQP